MPRKRKTNDQSVGGRNGNALIDTSFEPLSGNHMGSVPDVTGTSQTPWPHFPTHSVAEREQIFQSFQEMFAGKLDAEIVYMILTECDWKVEDAMEKLMQLTSDSDSERQNKPGLNSLSQMLYNRAPAQQGQLQQHQFHMARPDQRNQGPFLMHSDQIADSKQTLDQTKHLKQNMYPQNSGKDAVQMHQRPNLSLNVRSRLPSVQSSEQSPASNNLAMLSPRTPYVSAMENAEPIFPVNTDSESVQSAMQALDSFANSRGADLNNFGFGSNDTVFNQGNGFMQERQLQSDSLQGHQQQVSVNEMTAHYPHMSFHDENQTQLQRPVPMMQNPPGTSLTSQSNIPLPPIEKETDPEKQQDINGNEFAQLAAGNKVAAEDEKPRKIKISNSESMKNQRLKHKKQMQHLRNQHISLDPTERESLEKLIEEVIIDGIGKDAIFDDDDSSESDADSSSSETGDEKTLDGKGLPQANLKVAAKHMKNLPPRFLRRLQDNKGGKLTEEAFELLQFEQIPEEVEIPEMKEKVKHDSGGKKPKRTRYFLEGSDQFMDDSLLREIVDDKNKQLDTSLDDEAFLKQDLENLETLSQLTPSRSPKPGKIEGQYKMQMSDHTGQVSQGTMNIHDLEEQLMNAAAHQTSDIRQIGMEAANYQTLFSVNAPEFVPKSKTPTSEVNQVPQGLPTHVGQMPVSSHSGPKIQQTRYTEASNTKQNKLSSPMPHAQMYPMVSQSHVRSANSPVMMASDPPQSVTVPVSIGLSIPGYPGPNYPNVVGRASPQQLVAPRLVTSIPNAGLQAAQGRNSPSGKTFIIPKVTGPPPPPPPPPAIGVMQYPYAPYPYHAGFMPYQLRAPFIPPHGYPTTWAQEKAITDPKVLKALQKATMKEKNRLQQVVNTARPNSAPTYGAPNGKQNLQGGQNAGEQPTPPKQSSRRPIKLTKERLAKLLNDNNKILVIVRGCPGSGKSHIANEMKNEGVVLSTDDFFVKENGVYEHDVTRLGEAHEWNFKRAKKAMEEGINPVFIDNTNTQAWEMRPYVRAGIKMGYNIEFLEPDTAWKSNAKELAKRNTHNVPLATIEKMLERFEPEMTVEKVLGLSELPTEEVEEIQKEMEALSLHGEPKTTRRRRKRRRKRKNKNKQVSEEGGEEQTEAKAEEGSSDEDETTPERDHATGEKVISNKETLNSSENLGMSPNKKNPNSNTKIEDEKEEANLGTVNQDENIVSNVDGVANTIATPEKTVIQSRNNEEHKRQFDPQMLIVLEQTLKNILVKKDSKDLQELDKIVNELLDKCNATKDVRTHFVKMLHDVVNHEGELNEEVAKINSGADKMDSTTSLSFEKAYWQSEKSLEKTETSEKQTNEETSEVLCDSVTEPPKPKRMNTTRKARGSKGDSEEDTSIPNLQEQIDTDNWSFPPQKTSVVKKELVRKNSVSQDAETQTTEDDKIDSLKVSNGCETNVNSKIISGTPREIFTGICASIPQSKSGKVMIDASSMAQEEKSVDNLDAVDILKEHFPAVDIEDLREISQNCNHDPQWAINILLDSGFEYNEPKLKQDTQVKSEHQDFSDSHLPQDLERFSPPPLTILSRQSLNDSQGDHRTSEEQLQEICVKESVKRMRSIEEYQRAHPDEETRRKRYASTASVDTNHSLDHSFDSQHHLEAGAGFDLYAAEAGAGFDLYAAEAGDGLSLKLSPAMASQLMKMFGPVGFHISQDSFAPEDLAVTLDRKTAKYIHRSWARTLHEKFDKEENDIEKMMKQDEAFARQLQMEEDRKKAAHPSVQKPKLPQTYTSKTTGISVVQVNRKPVVCFKDILAEEKTIEEGKQDFVASAEKTNDTIATKMKKKKLQEMFPTYDEVLLSEIFASNGFSLEASIEVLQDIEKSTEPVKNVMTKEAAAELEEKQIQKAIEESTRDHWLGDDEDVEDGPEFQTMEDPVYKDYRAEASMHYKLRHENFQKAQEAYRRNLPGVAAWYSNLGHLHTEKLKEANRRAAEMILESRNRQFADSNTLDLHGLHVDEAIDALKKKIEEKTQERATQPGKTKLNFAVITGRGNHSRGGVARIKPAVMEFLNRNSISFTELHAGLIQVNLAPSSQ